jgi:hypothetical protein
MKTIFAATLGVGLLATTFAYAGTPAVTLTNPTDPISGGCCTVGFEFTVSSPEEITASGAFDEGGDGLTGTAQVGIWPQTTRTRLSGTAATLQGLFAYTAIAPFVLTPGTSYLIAAYEPDDSFLDIDVPSAEISFNSAVTFVGMAFSENDAFAYPENQGPGSASIGANFLFTSVPEPSTWAMMALGFAGPSLAGYRTRKRGRAAAAA